MRYRNRDVRIDADGESFTIRAQQVVVANCRYFGGGMMVAPTADPADGLLDVVVVGDLGRLESMRKMGSIYRGTHLDDPQVAHRRARRVEVACDTTLLLDVDGEQPGMAPATFEVMPRALGMIGNAPVTRV
jgi:diacylglycerol kinase (ATP)